LEAKVKMGGYFRGVKVISPKEKEKGAFLSLQMHKEKIF
jgi:hypothetical protein